MDEEVVRCFQKAIHTKRWYAKPSIKIEEKIVRTGSLTYRQTPKAICWSPFYRVTLDNFDIMCSKNEHSQSFSDKQNGRCLFVRGPIPPICNFSMA